MNTKEAIEFLESLKKIDVLGTDDYYYVCADITNILKRGEKFEEMWSNLKYDMCRMVDYDVEQDWLDTMNKIEQKHFPKDEAIK